MQFFFLKTLMVLGLLAIASCGESQASGLASISSTIYARKDSDTTSVWSPRQRASGKINEAMGVEAAFAVDSWSSASIDVRTAATKIIVREVRKEVTTGGHYEFPNATIGGGYRYSTENDYWSNGGVANVSIDMFENNTTLAMSLFGAKDMVGRSGDPNFKKPQSSVGGRVSLTQVIDPKTVISASLESTRVEGYQASPYRFVAIGGDGTCRSSLGSSDAAASAEALCVAERVPDQRVRWALVGHGRRALGDRSSMGLEYRYYTDNWGVYSHTINPDFALLVGEHGTFRLNYRYYTQSQADFYRPRYLDRSGTLTYVTRDRELSALYSNRVGLTYEYAFELGTDGTTMLTTALRGGFTRFKYLAFVGLDKVDAIEGTAMVSLDWR